MRSLLLTLPGMTTRRTASKFFRDSSSFQVVLPGDSGCNRSGVPDPWQAIHLAWPGRLARKMGYTRVLKNSKSSDAEEAGVAAGCWSPSPASVRSAKTTVIYTRPPSRQKARQGADYSVLTLSGFLGASDRQHT